MGLVHIGHEILNLLQVLWPVLGFTLIPALAIIGHIFEREEDKEKVPYLIYVAIGWVSGAILICLILELRVHRVRSGKVVFISRR